MKKLFIFIFTVSLCSCNLFAQDIIYLKHKPVNKISITDRTPQGVYGEFYGKSIFFSANYDRRFFKRVDGLGYSVGIGYIDIDGLSIFSIPIGVNYLYGANGKYLETGVGLSYINASLTSTDEVGSTSTISGHTILGYLTIGYRKQPINGGFMFRVGVNPLFFSNFFIPYPYISIGYSF